MKNGFFFIACPIILTVLGEFLLKAAVNDLDTTSVANTFHMVSFFPSDWVNHIVSMTIGFLGVFLTTPALLVPVLMILLGGVLWLVGMSKFELSFIYPFLSINYISVVVGSQFLLGEAVSLYRYLAVVFIGVGLFIISRSPHIENR